MKKVSFLLLCLVLIGGVSACGNTVEPNENPDQIFTDVAETVIAEITQEAIEQVDRTQIAGTVLTDITQTAQVNITPIPEATLMSSSIGFWSKNYAGSNDSGGVIIEIARVVIGNKESLPTGFNWHELDDYIPGWENTDVIGQIIFRITNNNSFTVVIYPNFGSIQIGNEQIELNAYDPYTLLGDNIQGEIYPGVTKVGGLWFGIKRSTPENINQIIYRCDAPTDANSYNPLSQNIEIVMNFNNHLFEDSPDELNDFFD